MKAIWCFFSGHFFTLNYAYQTRPKRSAWVFACHRCGKIRGRIEGAK